MTKAPERMWREPIAPSRMYPDGGAFYHETQPAKPAVAFVQEDDALALVAAENEACAAIVDDDCSRSCQAGSCTNCLAPRIRARTPDDATAALERVKLEARNEALREALEAVAEADSAELATHGAALICDRITDLITEGQSDGG